MALFCIVLQSGGRGGVCRVVLPKSSRPLPSPRSQTEVRERPGRKTPVLLVTTLCVQTGKAECGVDVPMQSIGTREEKW